ncbi:CG15425 [Drosophila busckii]|uniref:CG15425 n=1 Tax=Drosophila busckii TaxID=30019 RepID=A0A0M4ENP6_DROBS|nr:CG15425 [Drosophila busckii]
MPGNQAKKPLRQQSVKRKYQTQQTKRRKSTAQQNYLKHNYITVKQEAKPIMRRVWRRTVVQLKPKPKVRVPRLFRMDINTGLPLDYERNVSKIMSYVNPHFARPPNPDQVIEQMLTQALANIVGRGGDFAAENIRSEILKSMRQHTAMAKKPSANKQRANYELQQFHKACKRAPAAEQQDELPAPAPSRKHKLMYKHLLKVVH